MKLLIVDDEKLTREGILKSLPLEKLGIHHTFMADDGVHGLEIALKEKPDLILTDVRMPRMSGVEMAEEILKALPNAIILFMSAYSDKEYLKAAIKLKAVSYVDKPLDMNELTEALAEGIHQYRSMYTSLNAQWMHEGNLRSQLAQLLAETDPEEQAPVIGAQYRNFPLTCLQRSDAGSGLIWQKKASMPLISLKQTVLSSALSTAVKNRKNRF